MLHHDTVLLKKEAAQLLKISMTGLGRLLADGKIAKVQITPRRIGILKSDLDSFLQSNRMVGEANA
jgi:hypothetical protein